MGHIKVRRPALSLPCIVLPWEVCQPVGRGGGGCVSDGLCFRSDNIFHFVS